MFLLADEGYPGYAGMVLARDGLIASNPTAVKAFVDATAAGWKAYLYGDPKPADAMILKDNPEMTQDVLDQARAKMREKGIVLSGDATSQGVGAMTDARWASVFDVASSQNVYPKTMDYKSGYTLRFLPTGVKPSRSSLGRADRRAPGRRGRLSARAGAGPVRHSAWRRERSSPWSAHPAAASRRRCGCWLGWRRRLGAGSSAPPGQARRPWCSRPRR